MFPWPTVAVVLDASFTFELVVKFAFVVVFSVGFLVLFASILGSTTGLSLPLSCFCLGFSDFFSSGFFSSGFFSFSSGFFSPPSPSLGFDFKSKYFLMNLGKSFPDVAAFPKH